MFQKCLIKIVHRATKCNLYDKTSRKDTKNVGIYRCFLLYLYLLQKETTIMNAYNLLSH